MSYTMSHNVGKLVVGIAMPSKSHPEALCVPKAKPPSKPNDANQHYSFMTTHNPSFSLENDTLQQRLSLSAEFHMSHLYTLECLRLGIGVTGSPR